MTRGTASPFDCTLQHGDPVYVEAYQRSILGTFDRFVDMGSLQAIFVSAVGPTLVAAGQVHRRPR